MTDNENSLRVLFMGTPDFAVSSLDVIHQSIHNVVGVVTAMDKPAGRGRKLKTSAVKDYALANDLELFQPQNLKSDEFAKQLYQIQPDVIVVVAFRMLPKVVWDFPKYGTFNLHASLLPEYRGAAPINWAIMNGDTQTGVTTFFIDDKIDTGNVILQETAPIHKEDSVKELHDRLMILGSELVRKTLDIIFSTQGAVQTHPQKVTAFSLDKTAYKLNRENMKINWELAGKKIYDHIRGLSPYPASWCFLNEKDNQKTMKITKARFVSFQEFQSTQEDQDIAIVQQKKNGVLWITAKQINVKVRDGVIILERLQLPNKKSMLGKDLLNGYVFHENSLLS